jgi:hypothetical protein
MCNSLMLKKQIFVWINLILFFFLTLITFFILLNLILVFIKEIQVTSNCSMIIDWGLVLIISRIIKLSHLLVFIIIHWLINHLILIIKLVMSCISRERYFYFLTWYNWFGLKSFSQNLVLLLFSFHSLCLNMLHLLPILFFFFFLLLLNFSQMPRLFFF